MTTRREKAKTWKAWGVFDANDKLVAVRLEKAGAEHAAAWGNYKGPGLICYGRFSLAKPRKKK